jgi:hypothetical protein
MYFLIKLMMVNGFNLMYFLILLKMHGSGIYIWKDGRKYIGQYNHGVKHGYGEYYWPDGKIFKG